MRMMTVKVVIFSLLMEEINDRIDDIIYNDGFLIFYKNNEVYKSFNITNTTIVEATCETEIKQAYTILSNKIRSYGL